MEYTDKRKAPRLPCTKRYKRKTPKKIKTFDDYDREAAECGLSYGKYKAALKLGKSYEQLKAEYESRVSYD